MWATNVPDVVLVRLDRDRREPELSPAVARIAWARRFMSTAEGLAARLDADGTVRGLRVGLSMVLEPKTAVLALTLREAGAEVTVFAHPDETDDAVAGALTDAGLRVYARSDAGPAEHRELASAFLAERPQVLVDDGSHVIRLAHETAPEVLAGLIGAAEETTSGLRPLRTMADEGRLKIPVVAVNDARSKTLFDNRYGTGQSCLFTILGLTDLDLATSTVVVAGYGHVGEGVAHHARALGATVVVTELDPVRALAASFDGFRVAPLLEAVASRAAGRLGDRRARHHQPPDPARLRSGCGGRRRRRRTAGGRDRRRRSPAAPCARPSAASGSGSRSRRGRAW